MFYVIKEGYIFSCMIDKNHVPKEHRNFVFSEDEVLELDGPTMILIFNTNDLDGRELESTTKQEVVRVYLRELLSQFKLPERRNLMAKKEAPAGKDASKAEPKAPTKRDAVITVLAEKNPKREGSKAHERFEFYQTGQTVDQFLEAGGTMADVNYDVAKGFIELAEAAAAAE